MPSESKIPDTTPIENIVDFREFAKAYLATVSQFRRPLVALHKRKLGRQTTVFTSEYRHWVWVRPTWTVFVSDKKGVGFEVPVKMSREKAWAAWREYLRLMAA